MSLKLFSLSAFIVGSACLAVPSASQDDDAVQQLNQIANATFLDGQDATSTVSSILVTVTPTATPTGVAEASAALSSAVVDASPSPVNAFAKAAQRVSAGLTSKSLAEQLYELAEDAPGEGSDANVNPIEPAPAAYPRAGSSDAPYDISEATLRAAIHIPSTFKYGAGAQPIILVPGTSSTGWESFRGNLIPLLSGSAIADPVWLNVPHYLLDDAQSNAEYVAYAVNYIYGISNKTKVAVAAWSQGNIDSQWAYKYWPSTRGHMTDHIAISPDYHGAIVGELEFAVNIAYAPALWQQAYTSNFIATLRNNGGDSAIVPTTVLYSIWDEVVQPQEGSIASAYLLDANGAGVSNNEAQNICPGQPAGGIYTHEGMMYNPLLFALLKDALAHDGPGKTARLDLPSVCSTFLTPGLDLNDFLLTEDNIVFSAAVTLTYPDPVLTEPAIKGYAL